MPPVILCFPIFEIPKSESKGLPGNILLDASGNPLLSDFGISKILDDNSGKTSLTSTGVGIGTPEYMSPEQAYGGQTDGRTDIYALGIVFYTLVTGRSPFTGSTPIEVIIKHINDPLPNPKQFIPDLPDSVVNMLFKALAKDPNKRYQNMGELATDLENIANGKEIKEYPKRIPESRENKKPVLVKKSETLVSVSKPISEEGVRFSTFNEEELSTVDSDEILQWQQSSKMTVNFISALSPKKQQDVINLIGRDIELRIKDLIIHYGGGKFLFHGFKHFGSTVLVNQIVQLARNELYSDTRNRMEVLITATIELEETEGTRDYQLALVREFSIELINFPDIEEYKAQLDVLSRFDYVDIIILPKSMVLKVSPAPGLVISLSQKTKHTQPLSNEHFSGEWLANILLNILNDENSCNPNSLEQLLEVITNNQKLSSRIIFIIEKIESEKDFITFQKLRLFYFSTITFFVIVQHEEYLKWIEKGRKFIEKLGFRPYYVKCVWEEDYHLIRNVISEALVSDSPDILEDFINHIAFITNGATGDVFRELLDFRNIALNKGVPFLTLSQIRDMDYVNYNSRRQQVLADNWQHILGHRYMKVEERDQAKMGVYEIMEWMRKKGCFSIEEIKKESTHAQILISNSDLYRYETIYALLEVMITERLLQKYEDGKYRLTMDVEEINDGVFDKNNLDFIIREPNHLKNYQIDGLRYDTNKNENRFALIIGNWEFDDSRFRTLTSPDRDMEDFIGILKDPRIGGFRNVLSLANRNEGEIRRAIGRFYKDRKKDDLLLLYYSGHGIKDDEGRLYLAAKDTEYDFIEPTGIPASFITDHMDKSQSRRQVIILDSCFSGAFIHGVKGGTTTESVISKVGLGSAFTGNGFGRIILTASDSTQYAWEGEELIGDIKESLFTFYLVKGLKTGDADLDKDGKITVDEIFEYVSNNISSITSSQKPMKWAIKQEGEFIIANNPSLF
jgi:hypothetical protein